MAYETDLNMDQGGEFQNILWSYPIEESILNTHDRRESGQSSLPYLIAEAFYKTFCSDNFTPVPEFYMETQSMQPIAVTLDNLLISSSYLGITYLAVSQGLPSPDSILTHGRNICSIVKRLRQAVALHNKLASCCDLVIRSLMVY